MEKEQITFLEILKIFWLIKALQFKNDLFVPRNRNNLFYPNNICAMYSFLF